MRHGTQPVTPIHIALVAGLTLSCATPPPVPPAECASAWADNAAVNVLEGLRAATVPGPPVWAGHGLEQGSYVVNGGESSEGRACLAVVRAGETAAYGAFDTQPRFLTPLYGYHFTWESISESVEGLAALGEQPVEIKDWLIGLGVESAIVIPVRVEGFPFEISALQFVQIAIHEGFHVSVQTPRWLGYQSDWPVWDQQPDRPAVRACYTGSEAVATALLAERTALEGMVSALLDQDAVAACSAGREFFDHRAERYQLQGDVEVLGHNQEPIGCEMGEVFMELEEGIADYASWTVLYDRGRATREQLIGRYGAQQDEVFYLTGAMQLHAIALMDPAGFLQTTEDMAVSTGPEDGSLPAVLARQMESYCQ